MKPSVLAILLFAIASTLTLKAQKAGDSPASVEAALGRPGSKLSNGTKEIWLYPDGKKVVLTDGVVSQIEISAPKVSPTKPASVRPNPSSQNGPAPAPQNTFQAEPERPTPLPSRSGAVPSAEKGLRVILSGVRHELTLPTGYRIESQRNYDGEMSAFQSMGNDETYLGGTAAILGEDPVSAAQFATSGDDALKEGATVEKIDGWKIYVWTFEDNKKHKQKSFRAVKNVSGVGYTIAMIAAYHRTDAILKQELMTCLSSIKAIPRK